MTKKLEELFDLPPTEQEVDTAVPAIPQNRETLAALDDTIDKIDAALPAVRGLEATDTEMDEWLLSTTDLITLERFKKIRTIQNHYFIFDV